MQKEAQEPEQPNTETKSRKPTRVEILLVGTAWALFLFTLAAGYRIWSGPPQ